MTDLPTMTVHLDLDLGSRAELKEAWLLYTDPASGELRDVRCCKVVGGPGGELRLGTGHALTRRGLEGALRGLSGGSFTLAHRQVLASDAKRVLFYQNAGIQTLHFQTQDPSLNALSGQSFPQPALIFDVRPGRMRVAAFTGSERPSGGTRLYRAPYFNVFARDEVCWGSTQIPREVLASQPLEWSRAFFSSSFTHAGATLSLSRLKGTHSQMWSEASKAGSFKKAWLRPLTRIQNGSERGVTLEGWIGEG